MAIEKIPCKGQIQYNTGVIFFRLSDDVKIVFQRWLELGYKYRDSFGNDQPFFTLAMEMFDLNPYTLSPSYNYRGFGDSISGTVKIWHSHGQMPPDINEIRSVWPPRKAIPGKVFHPEVPKPQPPTRNRGAE